MLNTKSIKKKSFNEINFSESNQQNAGNNATDNKMNDTISNKEIIQLHNEKLNNQRNNLKLMDGVIKEREINKFMNNFKEENYTDNVQQNINNPVLQGGNNNLVKELATQLKNELAPPVPEQPQIILIAPKNNFADNNTNGCILNNNSAEWDDDKNAYVIYNNNNMEDFFTNNDVIKSIINGANINKSIKKYFFIIAHNSENNNNEFNFIDSVFTDNLDLIIKIQNELFDLINRNDLFENNDDNLDNLLIFNYQFIIYLFKKSNFLNNNDSNKIAKFYSTLTFRFSSLILKQVMKIENHNVGLLNDISKLFDIKKDIVSQLNNIENYLENNKVDLSNSLNNTNDVDVINISTDDNSTDDSTDNSTDNNLELTKPNNNTRALDEIISSLTSKTTKQSDSLNNGYHEINDNVSSYMDKQISGNLKTSATSSVNLKTNTYKITNKNTTTDPSYNKSSAIKNGQIYKIKL